MYQLLEGAARTYLLWLINTQNAALLVPPRPLLKIREKSRGGTQCGRFRKIFDRE
jgi:hypothetical protein